MWYIVASQSNGRGWLLEASNKKWPKNLWARHLFEYLEDNILFLIMCFNSLFFFFNIILEICLEIC